MTLEKSPNFLIGDTSSFMVDFPASQLVMLVFGGIHLFKFIDLMIDFVSSCRIPLAEKPWESGMVEVRILSMTFLYCTFLYTPEI